MRPHPFRTAASQVFIVHGFVQGSSGKKMVPLVYCFMSRRRAEDYDRVFHILKTAAEEAGHQLEVELFRGDFEKGK